MLLCFKAAINISDSVCIPEAWLDGKNQSLPSVLAKFPPGSFLIEMTLIDTDRRSPSTMKVKFGSRVLFYINKHMYLCICCLSRRDGWVTLQISPSDSSADI